MTLRTTRILLYIYALLNVFAVISGQPSTTETTYRKLRKHLFSNYDRNEKPTSDLLPLKAVAVQADLSPIHITELNENTGILTMEAWLTIYWHDPRMIWKSEDFSELSIIRLHPEEIWKPDITIWNSCGSHVSPWEMVDVLVYETGSVVWVPAATMYLICQPMDYSKYPRDIQTCKVILGSLTSDASTINMDFFKEGVSMYDYHTSSNPHWEVVNTTNKIRHDVSSEDSRYAALEFEIYLQRQNVQSSSLCTVPDLVARIMILCMFSVHSHTKKLLLGCTSLLILTVIAATVTHILPSPAAAPAALSQINFVLVLCIVAIIVEVLVSQLNNCGLGYPAFLDNIALTRMSFILTSCGRRFEDSDFGYSDSKWHLVGNVFEFIVFILIAVLLFAY